MMISIKSGKLIHQQIIILIFSLIVLNRGNKINISQLNEDKPVIMVIAVMRHGLRTAGDGALYPGDPLAERYRQLWPEGWLELTNQGKMDQYNLGKWFRQEYGSLVGNKYSKETVYALSTNADRSVMSAQCFMAGLFPPTNEEIWNQNLLWHPVPVHSFDSTAGNLLNAYDKVNCQRYWNEFESMINSQTYTDLLDKYKTLRATLHNNTGLLLNDFKQILYLYDYIEMQINKNVTIPSWTKGIYPEPWRSASVNYFILPTSNEPLKTLFMGPLIKEILNQFQSKISGTNKRIIYILSGHDDNISNLLNFFGTYNMIFPPYSSLVLMELRKNYKNEYFVTIQYKNSTLEEPYLQKIHGCDEICSFEAFSSILEPYVSPDWTKDCNNKSLPNSVTTNLTKFNSGVIIFCLLFQIIYNK